MPGATAGPVKAFTTGEEITYTGCAIYLGSDGLAYEADTAVDPIIGYSRHTAASGALVDVDLNGPVSIVRCGGDVTAGYPVCATTDGAVVDITGTDHKVWSGGIALESGTTGAEISVMRCLIHGGDLSAMIHGGS